MEYRQLQAYFFLGILVGVGLLTAFLFLPFFDALLLGAIFAVALEPLHRRIERALDERGGWPALLTTVILLLAVLGPLLSFGALVFQEAKDFYTSFDRGGAPLLGDALEGTVAGALPQGLRSFLPASTLDLRAYLAAVLNLLVENLGSIFSSTVKVGFTVVVSLFVFYYLLKDGRKLIRFLMTISPLSDRYDREILDTLLRAVRSVVWGTLVVAFVQGMLATVGFFVFGVPNAAIWGVVVVISALIPAVGTALVTFPASAYLFLTGSTGAALGLFLWSALLVGMIDNFLRPKLIERGTHLHPLLIFLSALGGIGLFGPIGFLAGPLVLSLFFALLRIYEDQFKEYLAKS
jgi:predicted PurR-regulated permease PerM